MSTGPNPHEVISASAGSGKTHQLTNRYLSLLAAGCESDGVLATTFTRKAAAEILDRVLSRLATAAGDAKDAAKLASQIEAASVTQRDLVALLRKMLQSLHRVRIGTLDSFYIRLASSFSLELGLPGGWTICEETDDTAMKAQALENLLEAQPDDIAKLLPLLTKGEMKRSVHEALIEVVGAHYESYASSDRLAWESVHVPAEIPVPERNATLDRLRAFNFSKCGHKGFLTAQTKDVVRFEQEDWDGFVGGGLAKQVLAGEATYYKKTIPSEACDIYSVLLQHARGEILKRLADQTRATWDLLDRFHQQLHTLKQESGALRFGEVTQAIAIASRQQKFTRQWLGQDSLAFRLDGAIDHLLLDEFQDTALAQWRVLEPIARRITKDKCEKPRSFFCVGDVKQAIYGWRGGMVEIFATLGDTLGDLHERPLLESRRSAQPIIDVVNKVFSNLGLFRPGDKFSDGLEAWGRRFAEHTTAQKGSPGYVCLHTGPAQEEGENVAAHRGRHCHFVAAKVRELVQQVPGCSIGILCRTNDTIARIIYELREAKVEASEEGGNPLTDSAAVELMLSLFTLADHPSHSIAWFHLQNSPLKNDLPISGTPHTFSAKLRDDLQTSGYGPFTHAWAIRVAPACNHRDLRRLQQLIEIAYAYQSRATLRTDDFVSWVRNTRVPDPSEVSVRVMSIHAAKGLQFDFVILPELDTGLLGSPPAIIVGRDAKSLDVNFVCRYASEEVQVLLAPQQRRVFETDRKNRVEESLSLLYVAMTRAKYAMYMYIPGERKGRSNRKDAWYNLLMQTLAPGATWAESAILFQHGDEKKVHAVATVPPQPLSEVSRPDKIEFRSFAADRRRGLEHVAPSRREGKARIDLGRLFNPSEEKGTAAGTLYHAWFAAIGWLDDSVPTDAELVAIAEKLRMELPSSIWNERDQFLATFRTWLRNPAISAVLRRAAYENTESAGFPSALASIWREGLEPRSVDRERRFFVHDGSTFLNGSFDRVVWLGEKDRIIASDVIDFKTDAIPPGDEPALQARVEYYRPQLEAYRRAVVRLSKLPAESISTRLVFTTAARVVHV